MKKTIGILIAAIAVIAMVFGLTACSGGNASVDPNAYSFVTIDINPSVELIALGDNVIEVKAANYDACVLLEGEDFSSMTVEDATAKIVSLADEMGYLTGLNNQVKISVISDDAQTVEILKSAAKTGAQKGSKKAVAVAETRLQDELTVKKLKEEKPDKFADLTEEKVRLIEAVMEYDSSMTYEIGAEMSVKALSTALKSALNENKEIFTAELRNEYSARYTAAKQEIERNIAAVYGDEYLGVWEKYTALENIYNAIVSRLDKSEMSDGDVATVIDLLEIADASLIEKGGIVRADYVWSYIDKHVNKKDSQISSTALNAVIEILDGYDVKNYVLTEEEITAVNEAAGEEVGFASLAEFAAELSERKAELDEIANMASLTDEQIATIRELKEEFASIKENVLDGMQEIIDAARAEILAAKQERGSIE